MECPVLVPPGWQALSGGDGFPYGSGNDIDCPDILIGVNKVSALNPDIGMALDAVDQQADEMEGFIQVDMD